MQYEAIQPATATDVREALDRSEIEKASRLIIGMALHSPHADSAAQICVEAAGSSHPIIRGNAVLGLGHLARRFGQLERSRVEPVLAAALADPEPYVRSQAAATADDIRHFLGWPVHA
jgi:hypothetical protein